MAAHGFTYYSVGRPTAAPKAPLALQCRCQPEAQEIMKEQRALVTGRAGFLGSHLCDALLAEGWLVVAVDNLLTGTPVAICRIFRDEPRFEFLELDITEPFDCGKVDYVFHFASPASPVDYARAWHRDAEVGFVWARFTRWMWRGNTGRNFWSPRLRSVMAIPGSIRRTRRIGGM